MFEKVLVAVDGSQFSEAPLAAAEGLAARQAPRLRLSPLQPLDRLVDDGFGLVHPLEVGGHARLGELATLAAAATHSAVVERIFDQLQTVAHAHAGCDDD